LLQKGAIVDKEGKEGETALQLAAAGGHHDALKILLSEGADLNHIDEVSIVHNVTTKICNILVLELFYEESQLKLLRYLALTL
jgi:hypothetical protein